MRKTFVFIFCCFFAGLCLTSCGGSEQDSAKECENNFGCPMGQECSSEGVCVDIKKGGNGGPAFHEPDDV